MQAVIGFHWFHVLDVHQGTSKYIYDNYYK